jgi:Ni/Co efflux regulator RcnB
MPPFRDCNGRRVDPRSENKAMKMLTLVAAAAAALLAVPAASASTATAPATITAAAFAASATALPQDGRRWDRHERRTERRRHHRRAYYRSVCTRKWRNGHRTRVCRRVRYYR